MATARRHTFGVTILAYWLLVPALLVAGCAGDDLVPRTGTNDPPPAGCETTGDCPPPAANPEPSLPPTFETLASPVRSAITPAGRLLVVDSEREMVFYVEPGSAQPLGGFQTRGKPLGVALMGSRIYVGNVTKGTLDIHDSQGGGFRRASNPGSLEYPAGIAADPISRKLYVLDGGTGEIKVFDELGQLQRVIVRRGTGDDRLLTPTAIAIDTGRAELLVSDYGDVNGAGEGASIKIFDYEGNFRDVIRGDGSCGSLGCSGGFSRPQGLAAYEGRVYLADAVLAQVLIYERSTLERVTEIGGRDLGIRLALDVAVTPDRDVLVLSNRTATVVAFPGGAVP